MIRAFKNILIYYFMCLQRPYLNCTLYLTSISLSYHLTFFFLFALFFVTHVKLPSFYFLSSFRSSLFWCGCLWVTSIRNSVGSLATLLLNIWYPSSLNVGHHLWTIFFQEWIKNFAKNKEANFFLPFFLFYWFWNEMKERKKKFMRCLEF